MASYPKLLNHPQTSHIPTASHQGPKSALSLAPSHTFPVAAHQTTPHFAYTPGESHRKHPNSAAASQVRQGPLRPSQACGLVLAAPPPTHTLPHFTTLHSHLYTAVKQRCSSGSRSGSSASVHGPVSMLPPCATVTAVCLHSSFPLTRVTLHVAMKYCNL